MTDQKSKICLRCGIEFFQVRSGNKAWEKRKFCTIECFNTINQDQKIWSKVNKNGPIPNDRPELGNCWNWMASTTEAGYAKTTYFNKTRLAHRIIYELLKEKIPKGLHLDHLCRNTRCVNPKHLEPVTVRENLLRGKGPVSENHKKTHCKYGHELQGENLIYKIVNGWPRRSCRTCVRRIKLASYHRLKNKNNENTNLE
jgi:hypothetical protein